MAVIKCPECGHQVSDRAHTCPSCGVEIEGKITTCANCGAVYFKEDGECPECHASNGAIPQKKESIVIETPNRKVVVEKQETEIEEPVEKKKNYTSIIVSALIAIILCGICIYYYTNANQEKENEAYEYAMISSDPQVLEDYLLNYTDAPQEHRDSIEAHLQILKLGDTEWNNAVVSGSRAELQHYIDTHPNSMHLSEARHLVDSIDWSKAEKDLEALALYIEQHPLGEHIDEAQIMMKKADALKVSDVDKEMVTEIFYDFFRALSLQDETLLTQSLNSLMDNFIGKSNATKNDAISWMHRMYKEDITKMDWRINDDFKITKKAIEGAENEFEYGVDFSVDQKIDRTDQTKDTFVTYKIKAKVTPQMKITEYNMTRINN